MDVIYSVWSGDRYVMEVYSHDEADYCHELGYNVILEESDE